MYKFQPTWIFKETLPKIIKQNINLHATCATDKSKPLSTAILF